LLPIQWRDVHWERISVAETVFLVIKAAKCKRLDPIGDDLYKIREHHASQSALQPQLPKSKAKQSVPGRFELRFMRVEQVIAKLGHKLEFKKMRPI